MKDDAHILDFEASWQLGTQRVDVVDVDIEELASFCAYRVVVFFDIGVEPHRLTIAMHELNLPHCGEFVKRLVHRAQRNTRHALARHREQTFGGGVRFVAVHQREQQLTLRRQAAALLAILVGNDGW